MNDCWIMVGVALILLGEDSDDSELSEKLDDILIKSAWWSIKFLVVPYIVLSHIFNFSIF